MKTDDQIVNELRRFQTNEGRALSPGEMETMFEIIRWAAGYYDRFGQETRIQRLRENRLREPERDQLLGGLEELFELAERFKAYTDQIEEPDCLKVPDLRVVRANRSQVMNDILNKVAYLWRVNKS